MSLLVPGIREVAIYGVVVMVVTYNDEIRLMSRANHQMCNVCAAC